MIDYNTTDITNPLDDLFVSVNDIYEQYDEGAIDYYDAVDILKRTCQHFLEKSKMQIPSNNYERAVQVYEDGGVDAVFQAVRDGFIHADSYRDCIPCEMRTPHEGDDCLVCGTHNPQRAQNQAKSHAIYFAKATDCFLWLEENEILTPVTLTLHLGD